MVILWIVLVNYDAAELLQHDGGMHQDTDGDGIFIHIKVAVMEPCGNASLLISDAKIVKTAGDVLGVTGEVLAAHAKFGGKGEMPRPQKPFA